MLPTALLCQPQACTLTTWSPARSSRLTQGGFGSPEGLPQEQKVDARDASELGKETKGKKWGEHYDIFQDTSIQGPEAQSCPAAILPTLGSQGSWSNSSHPGGSHQLSIPTVGYQEVVLGI